MTVVKFKASGVPKYKQVAAAIARDIVSGRISLGEFMPSMLDLANFNGVSIDTIVKCYKYLKECEVLGMNISRRYFVVSNAKAFSLRDGDFLK